MFMIVWPILYYTQVICDQQFCFPPKPQNSDNLLLLQKRSLYEFQVVCRQTRGCRTKLNMLRPITTFPCDHVLRFVIVDLFFAKIGEKRSSISTSICTATSSTTSRYGSRSSRAPTIRPSPRRPGKPPTSRRPSSSLSCTLVWTVTRGKTEHGCDTHRRQHDSA